MSQQNIYYRSIGEHPLISFAPNVEINYLHITTPNVIFTIRHDGRWIRSDDVDITDDAAALRAAFMEYLHCTRGLP